jgi:hypothetical protein
LAVIATLSKGYDLDYIWRQVDQGAVKDAASYYIQASERTFRGLMPLSFLRLG